LYLLDFDGTNLPALTDTINKNYPDVKVRKENAGGQFGVWLGVPSLFWATLKDWRPFDVHSSSKEESKSLRITADQFNGQGF
jgi:hypothetical protein